jgi:hypothetical protein
LRDHLIQKDRVERPVEELAVELAGLRQIGRGDVEPRDAAGAVVGVRANLASGRLLVAERSGDFA